MSDLCSNYSYQGANGSCSTMLQMVTAGLVTDKGTTQTEAQFKDLTAAKVIVAAAAGATGIFLDFGRGYEKTSPDNGFAVSSSGYDEKTMNALPTMKVYAKANPCDYKTLFGLEGKPIDLQLFLNNPLKMGTKTSTGAIKGFRCRMYFTYGLPSADNAQQSFPIDIKFDDWEEFKNFYVDKYSHGVTELKDAIPVGVNISGDGTIATGGNIAVSGEKRCTDQAYSDFSATANWAVDKTNADDVALTFVSVANGEYVLNVQKNASTTPVDLAAGEYVEIQGATDDGTYITYASNIIKFTA